MLTIQNYIYIYRISNDIYPRSSFGRTGMLGKRIAREKICVEKMIMIYCKAKHRTDKVKCEDCQALLDYACKRLDSCKFGEHKPVCLHCPIHCYSVNMRNKIKDVMRFSGARMMFQHPTLAVLHLFDSFRDSFKKV